MMTLGLGYMRVSFFAFGSLFTFCLSIDDAQIINSSGLEII